MSYIEKIQRKIKTLNINETMPFSAVKIDGISIDTTRKILHRLHDNGFITIVSRGYFKREESFNELLFVYGSLKKGFDNHKLLDKYAKRLGKANTVKKFGMFEDTFGNYPYLIDAPYNKVKGELYQITRKEVMEKIDEFEGAPDYYQRERIEVKSHHGVNRAFVYIQTNITAPSDQEALKEWNNNSNYKIQKLNNYLNNMIES
ncbi:MAG: gamma-glutamylcyclotransferase [Sulfurimonas sp.]|nr:gamma-glutamylcyclotransferase [Sulfurimonas sp.]